MELTDRQQVFLDYLMRQQQRAGKVPSLRQAAGDLGISHTAVAQLLAQLEKKGVVERAGRYSRSLRIRTGRSAQPFRRSRGREVPIVGQVTAGLPMYAQQEWDGSLVVDDNLFSGEGLFALRVSGDSMRGAGILNGDLVICTPRQYAEQGEIVAVLIHHEEATVKRFYRREAGIELYPDNPDYPVLRYAFDDVLVQGKVIGVVRELSTGVVPVR